MRQDLKDQLGNRRPDRLDLAYGAYAPTDASGKVPDGDRSSWLQHLAGFSVEPDYGKAFNYWKESLNQSGDHTAFLTLESRLLVGHGTSSATDFGITLHHTWGVPVIPGSALKGLTAHFVETVFGPAVQSDRPWESDELDPVQFQGVTWKDRRITHGPGRTYQSLFGAPDAESDKAARQANEWAGASRGLVTFHDALYVYDNTAANKPFAQDGLTPHQKDYYDDHITHGSAATAWPNDYTDPVPLGFMTVRPKVRLLLALSGDPDWTPIAAEFLTQAFKAEWGVGGKTSSGYGRAAVGAWTAHA